MVKTSRIEGLPIIIDQKTKIPIYTSLRELRVNYQFGVSRIEKFFNGLREGVVYASKCRSCGETYFPPQADCTKCKSSDIEFLKLSGEAELETYTVINIKPSTFTHYKDYVVAIGKLKEGVKALAWLEVDDPSKIRIGMKLKLEVVKREPEGVYTYAFKPYGDGNA